MPYIKPEYRAELEESIKELSYNIKRLASDKDVEIEGPVNYAVTRLLSFLYDKPSYGAYNRAIGVLECIKQELYRMIVSKYEDQKIEENGTVWGSYVLEVNNKKNCGRHLQEPLF